MNLKLGLASVLFLGIFSGCAFRSQLPAGNTAYVAPEPVVFDAPFAPSPQYAATLEGGPHYTQGPELKRWMPEDTAPAAEGKRGRGLPAPVNAKGEADDAVEGGAIADKGAPSGGPVAAPPPPPRRLPTIERQSTAPGGSWSGPSTGHPDPASASSF